MGARELLARERILFELHQFLELSLFLLDTCSLSSQGLGSLLGRTAWPAVPGSLVAREEEGHLGCKHLPLLLVKVSLAQGLEPSESLEDR